MCGTRPVQIIISLNRDGSSETITHGVSYTVELYAVNGILQRSNVTFYGPFFFDGFTRTPTPTLTPEATATALTTGTNTPSRTSNSGVMLCP